MLFRKYPSSIKLWYSTCYGGAALAQALCVRNTIGRTLFVWAIKRWGMQSSAWQHIEPNNMTQYILQELDYFK